MNFGLLNIVVGVFVENSISEAAADAEHKLKLKEHAFHRRGERPAPGRAELLAKRHAYWASTVAFSD